MKILLSSYFRNIYKPCFFDDIMANTPVEYFLMHTFGYQKIRELVTQGGEAANVPLQWHLTGTWIGTFRSHTSKKIGSGEDGYIAVPKIFPVSLLDDEISGKPYLGSCTSEVIQAGEQIPSRELRKKRYFLSSLEIFSKAYDVAAIYEKFQTVRNQYFPRSELKYKTGHDQMRLELLDTNIYIFVAGRLQRSLTRPFAIAFNTPEQTVQEINSSVHAFNKHFRG